MVLSLRIHFTTPKAGCSDINEITLVRFKYLIRCVRARCGTCGVGAGLSGCGAGEGLFNSFTLSCTNCLWF